MESYICDNILVIKKQGSETCFNFFFIYILILNKYWVTVCGWVVLVKIK